MVDICDQPRAISNHYETTLLPEIYQAVSNYFFWGVSASRPPPAQDMHGLIFMEDPTRRMQSSEE